MNAMAIAMPQAAAEGAPGPGAAASPAGAAGGPGVFAQLLAALAGGATQGSPQASGLAVKREAEPTLAPDTDLVLADLLADLEALVAAVPGPDAPVTDENFAALEAIEALLSPAAALPESGFAGQQTAAAARLDALAARLTPLAPHLADALAALAARLRTPPPPSTLQATAPAPAEPAAPASAAGNAEQALRTAAESPRPVATPPANPLPEAAIRTAIRAETDPVAPRATGIERAGAELRLDTALTSRPVAPAAGMERPAIDLPALAVEIVRRFHAGLDRFQIRLDPPELGRIEVRLDIDAGRIAARLTVDRPETLDLLQRDARVLERALNQAGLGGDRPSLEFTLRHNPFAGQQDAGLPAATGSEARPGAPSATLADLGRTQTDFQYRGFVRPGGIDFYA